MHERKGRSNHQGCPAIHCVGGEDGALLYPQSNLGGFIGAVTRLIEAIIGTYV